MIHFQNRNRVANLVGLVLKGSKVEAHAPNEISKNRFELRCDCGEPFFALTQAIRGSESNGNILSCASCKAKRVKARNHELERHVCETKRRASRCPHGFVVELGLCSECVVECAICGDGHVSKLCPSTEVGKRRLAERGAA